MRRKSMVSEVGTLQATLFYHRRLYTTELMKGLHGLSDPDWATKAATLQILEQLETDQFSGAYS